MSAVKTTPWFVGVKPSREGVYQQLTWGGQLGYQKWEGGMWHSWAFSPEAAARSKTHVHRSFQNDPWRGLMGKQS